MKAITIASLTTLAFAGAACSEATSKDVAEATPSAEKVTVSAEVDDGFNLRIPGDTSSTTVANDGFNLGTPDLNAAPENDGFNLPDNLPTSGGLEAVPEIDTSLLEDGATAEMPDEDEIIRLDP